MIFAFAFNLVRRNDSRVGEHHLLALCGLDFGSSSEGHFAAIFRNGQNYLDEIAVVPGGFGFIRKFSRPYAFLLLFGRIRERSGVSKCGKAEAGQDGHILRFFRVEPFKERKRIDKFVAVIKTRRD